jgi:hypothetical protein
MATHQLVRLAVVVVIATAVSAVAPAQNIDGIFADYASTSWTERDGLPSTRSWRWHRLPPRKEGMSGAFASLLP